MPIGRPAGRPRLLLRPAEERRRLPVGYVNEAQLPTVEIIKGAMDIGHALPIGRGRGLPVVAAVVVGQGAGPRAAAVGQQQAESVAALGSDDQAMAVGQPDGRPGGVSEVGDGAGQGAAVGRGDADVAAVGESQPAAVGRPLRRAVPPVDRPAAVGRDAPRPAAGDGLDEDVGAAVALPDKRYFCPIGRQRVVVDEVDRVDQGQAPAVGRLQVGAVDGGPAVAFVFLGDNDFVGHGLVLTTIPSGSGSTSTVPRLRWRWWR